MPDQLIALDRVTKTFAVKGKPFTALADVTFEVGEREVLCLVGESGSGKTTAGKLMAGLLTPTAGRVVFRGEDTRRLRGAAWRAYRLGVQMIHQDPFASLNPTQRVEAILSAPLRRHRLVRDGRELRTRLAELLVSVGLTPPEDILPKFPHQLSGGQRQRVSMARALTVSPAFLIADEAVSMVDVSIRVSLLDTLRELRERVGLGVLFITHDLALARYFAGDARIAVMHHGAIVEIGRATDLIERPQHAYTKELLAAAPAGLEADEREPTRRAEPQAASPRAVVSELLRRPDDERRNGLRNGDPAALVAWQVEGSGVRTRATKGGPHGE